MSIFLTIMIAILAFCAGMVVGSILIEDRQERKFWRRGR